MFFLSCFVFAPYTLHVTIGDYLEQWHYALFFFLFFGTIFVVMLQALKNDNLVRREQRRFRSEAEQVLDQTYRCVMPQILNSMVVFPIKVQSRDATRDIIVRLDEDFLTIELAQGGRIGPPLTYRDGEEGMRQRQIAMKERGEKFIVILPN